MSGIKSLLESKITWAIILLLIFYITFVFSEKYADILELRVYIYDLKGDINELEEENKLLTEKVNLLNTNPYIEKIAREELDMVKPNEILYKATRNQ
jgi:cell division protein DivIC